MPEKPSKPDSGTRDQTETIPSVPPHGLKQKITAESSSAEAWLVPAGFVLLVTTLSVWILNALWSWTRGALRGKSKEATLLPQTPWQALKTAVDAIDPGEVDSERHGAAEVMAGQMSLLLRRALEIKTGRPFAERTTDEIKSWSAHGLDLRMDAGEADFFAYLDQLDRVRYAGKAFDRVEAERLLSDLKKWVAALEGARS